jgi:serine/threonine protein kinase
MKEIIPKNKTPTPTPTPGHPAQQKKNTGIKKECFRGYIQSKEAIYYIINEIVSGENTRVFSAVKFVSKGGKEKIIDDNKYCVRYLSKDWIINEVFAKLQIPEERVQKFFDGLKRSYQDFKMIKHSYIQELKDYIEDDHGIYIVLEFCDWTLKDYIQILREPLKNSKFPFEVKIRKIILQILETLSYIQDNTSQCFGGMLNTSDIMISEYSDSTNMGSSNIVVKFPHPFMAHLFTILKIYSLEKFPSYYAPEVYKLFEAKEVEKVIEKKDSFDIGSLLTKINQNLDMWALGYLLFEIIFDNPPFAFDDLNSAVKTLKPSFTYKIYPYNVSPLCLKIMNLCLQLEPQDRIQSYYLNEIIEDMRKDNDNPEELDKQLRLRMKDKNMKEEFELFNLNSLSYDKFL